MDLTAHIIDDEINGQEVLISLISKYCKNINVIDISSSVQEAVKKLNSNKADVLFLDIEMPTMNGFKIFDFINPENYQIIFATAYNQYAQKAFKVAAIDYLLKPIDIEELKAAVKKLKPKANKNEKEKINVLLSHINNQTKRIAIPTADGFINTPINEIYFCEADDNYCLVHLKNNTQPIYSPRTLKYFESRLLDFNFFRCNKSFLINIGYVNSFKRGKNAVIEMDNTKLIKLSASKKNAFKRIFEG